MPWRSDEGGDLEGGVAFRRPAGGRRRLLPQPRGERRFGAGGGWGAVGLRYDVRLPLAIAEHLGRVAVMLLTLTGCGLNEPCQTGHGAYRSVLAGDDGAGRQFACNCSSPTAAFCSWGEDGDGCWWEGKDVDLTQDVTDLGADPDLSADQYATLVAACVAQFPVDTGDSGDTSGG